MAKPNLLNLAASLVQLVVCLFEYPTGTVQPADIHFQRLTGNLSMKARKVRCALSHARARNAGSSFLPSPPSRKLADS